MKALTTLDGISDLKVDLPVQEPTFQIEVDLAKAQQYGIKPGDVRRTAAILFSGVMVGNLFEEQKVFDVIVWSIPEVPVTAGNCRRYSSLFFRAHDNGSLPPG